MAHDSSGILEDWSIQTSIDGEDLEANPEELENLYLSIANGSIPELHWKCPGRRAPSPVVKEEPKIAENTEKEIFRPAKNDFDFMDDVSLPQMRVRGQNSTPKGSAKKKTANFQGIIETLKKQMLSQNKEGN